MVKKLSEAQVEGRKVLAERADGAEEDEASAAAEKAVADYDAFWAAFGKSMKLGASAPKCVRCQCHSRFPKCQIVLILV